MSEAQTAKNAARERQATIKIGDFGLAVRDTALSSPCQPEQVCAEPARTRVSSSSVGGTEVYQPPECFFTRELDEAGGDDALAGEQTGPAVDAWGLGCALYEMATCISLPTEPPFLGQLVGEANGYEHVLAIAQRFDDCLAISATVFPRPTQRNSNRVCAREKFTHSFLSLSLSLSLA